MLDRKFIIEHAELVKENCRRRGAKADVDRLRRPRRPAQDLQTEIEELNRKANELSKSIGKAKDQAERETLKDQGRDLRTRTAEIQKELETIEAEQEAIHRLIPNLSHPDAPVGVDDQANLELFRGQTPAAQVRLQAPGPRRTGREARSGGFRGRGPRGRPRLLLPQERGRPAGTGPATLRPGGAAGRGLHAHDHPRPRPQRSAGGHRLHPPRAGNANLQHRAERPEPGGHGRDHAGRPAWPGRPSRPKPCR